MIELIDKKKKAWKDIETHINNLLFHVRVCERSKKNLCKGVVEAEIIAIARHYHLYNSF